MSKVCKAHQLGIVSSNTAIRILPKISHIPSGLWPNTLVLVLSQFLQKTIPMKLFHKLFLAMATTLLMQQAFAWGVTGHRVVAEIAQRHLSKKTKKAIEEIIGNQSLALWANWPDFIKSDSTWNHASKWHYVDLPGHIGKEEFVTGLKALPAPNLYTQIPAVTNQVKDKSLPIEKRTEALAFLIHLIGDLHQPLHVGRDEDQGGNKIQVMWFDKKTNVHSVWDSYLVDFQQYSYTEYATELNKADNTQVRQWQQSSLDDWFYESHVLSDKIYDQTPNDAKLSYRYNFIFKTDLDNQLLKGGVRLAQVLNEAFK